MFDVTNALLPIFWGPLQDITKIIDHRNKESYRMDEVRSVKAYGGFQGYVTHMWEKYGLPVTLDQLFDWRSKPESLVHKVWSERSGDLGIEPNEGWWVIPYTAHKAGCFLEKVESKCHV